MPEILNNQRRKKWTIEHKQRHLILNKEIPTNYFLR